MDEQPGEILGERMLAKGSVSELRSVIKSIDQLSHDNRLTLRAVIYDTIKLVLCKQQRLEKPELTKQQISKLLNLAYFINTVHSCVDCKGPLAECMGSIDEKKAREYFLKNIARTVTDYFGREVQIPEKAVRCIYKDYATGGAHLQSSEAYEEFRGKTLPWIHHTLKNSRKVLYHDSATVITYYYCMDFKLFYEGKTEQVTFVVIAKQEKKSILQPIVFKTSFRFSDYDRFLKVIEKTTPYKYKKGS